MKHENYRFLRTIFTLLFGVMLSINAYAQEITVTGTVKDQTGEPVIGVNVIVKGTTVGTITNIDGEFTLKAKMNDVLVASFIGYATQEVPVTSKTLTITLKENAEFLDEVVVLGYGANARKQDLSAAVGVISNTDELASRAVSSTEIGRASCRERVLRLV